MQQYIDDANESQHAADFFVYYSLHDPLPAALPAFLHCTEESAVVREVLLYKIVNRVFDKYVYRDTFRCSLSSAPVGR